METPSSARRVTRSQALAAANNSNTIPLSRKVEESEKGVSKSRQRSGKQQDRSALIDITNDSPIVGLAMGSLETPSSTFSKKRINSQSKHATTPGSGEALLRGQVKTLLQKVEEEAVLSKISLEFHPLLHHHHQGLVNSPMALLAPTPANTPQVSDLSGNSNSNNNGLASDTSSPAEEQFKISQMLTDMIDGKKQESGECEKNSMITRSLLLDFSDKSEGSDSSDCSSVLTYQGCENKSPTDDDDASIWSVQVNASTIDEEEEEEDADDYNDYEEEEDDGGWLVDELCEGMRKISVNGGFTGKHTRFVYNSEDEMEGEEEEGCGGDDDKEVRESMSSSWSGGILRLKGLPTPKGKHLRFPEED